MPTRIINYQGIDEFSLDLHVPLEAEHRIEKLFTFLKLYIRLETDDGFIDGYYRFNPGDIDNRFVYYYKEVQLPRGYVYLFEYLKQNEANIDCEDIMKTNVTIDKHLIVLRYNMLIYNTIFIGI